MDQVIIRPGRLEDEPHVKELARNTFAWGDYVGEVYGRWVAEMAGGGGDVYVAIAVKSGEPIGVIHTDYLSPEEAWFEGIRVHPAFRRQGIGRLLTAASIERARHRGARICRTAIDGDNEKSVGLARSVGFHVVATILQFEGSVPAWSASDARSQQQRPAALDDAPAICRALEREMRYVGSDYRWWKVNPQNVERVIRNGNLRIATDGTGNLVAGAALSDTFVDYDAEKPAFCTELASVFGDVEGILALAKGYELETAGEASRQALPRRLCITCEGGSPAVEALRQCGFTERVDEKILLWEIELNG